MVGGAQTAGLSSATMRSVRHVPAAGIADDRDSEARTPAAVLVGVLVGGWGDHPSTAPGLLANSCLLTFGAFAAVSGVLAVVVNMPSIYSRLVVGSERHAIRQRVGAWKLILANTILTTTSWIAYCGFAVHTITQSM